MKAVAFPFHCVLAQCLSSRVLYILSSRISRYTKCTIRVKFDNSGTERDCAIIYEKLRRKDVLINRRCRNEKRRHFAVFICEKIKQKFVRSEAIFAILPTKWRANTGVCQTPGKSISTRNIVDFEDVYWEHGSRFAEKGCREECQVADRSVGKIPESLCYPRTKPTQIPKNLRCREHGHVISLLGTNAIDQADSVMTPRESRRICSLISVTLPKRDANVFPASWEK